ncbi:amidase [Limobrevibacterium gyesilva]|nr:amidase [Limobrevibacterium gyesilva]
MGPFPTISEASAQIAARKLSPVELTRHCLDRIATLNPVLHAFIRRTEDRALAEARAAEARVMAGAAKGPLDGIPIAHKDIYNTAGIATTAHSKLLQDHVPAADGTAVRRLAEAGTVMLGKLATHEFAFGGPSFDLPWPPARNPWNTDHFTGGSSSGTGAAVAAGLILGGTGSDTGGSIRGPASFCGIAGIKPTYGLVSRAGIQPLSFSLDHAGPMAWTVEDCAMLLQAMAGHDAADPASADRAVPDFSAKLRQGVRGLRIGVIRHFHEVDVPVADTTRQGIEAALEVWRGLGAEIRDVTLSPLTDYQAVGMVVMLAEAYAVHEPWLKTRFNDYGEIFRDRMALGGMIRAADYVQALRRRRELWAEMKAALDSVDILVTASTSSEAPRIDAALKWVLFTTPNFTFPCNVTGFPALSLCCGFTPAGLPLSLQLIARPFDEATLFRAGHAYEQATPWRGRRPAV